MTSEPRRILAHRVEHFSESVIREMTRLAQKHQAINLGQGMPDFEAPAGIQEAACQAIRDGFNQYAITWGAPRLRQAIAAKAKAFNGIVCNPETDITVCCGATECMMATMMALIDPGDEVIVFQPFYENYVPDALLTGATPVWVPLRWPDWSFDRDQLAQSFTPKTKAIILNTPNNPTGKVFSRDELQFIADLCQKHNVLVFSDEIYEHIRYGSEPHVSIASLPGMADRTVTINGLSKTFSVTGWRLGYCIASPLMTSGIRKAHDFLTVGAPHPLQIAGAVALEWGPEYFEQLGTHYRERRDLFVPYLQEAGFSCAPPDGAYYVMTDISSLTDMDDTTFVRWMIEQIGVSAVPGSSFYRPKEQGRSKVRFMFAKRDETLIEAGQRLLRVREELERCGKLNSRR